MQALSLLADLHLDFVEQPVAAGDVLGLAELRGHGVPIFADESIYSTSDLTRLIDARAVDGVSLYIGKSASLEAFAANARIAAAFGIEVVVGSNAEMGVGAAAMIHMAASSPTLGRVPSDIIGQHFYEEDILATPLEITDGLARLPGGLGLGVEIRDDIRKRFA